MWSKERSLLPSPSVAEGLVPTWHRGTSLEQIKCSTWISSTWVPCVSSWGFDRVVRFVVWLFLGWFFLIFLIFLIMDRVAYHHEVFKLQLRMSCTPWGMARWLMWVFEGTQALLEQSGGSWTWCSPTQTTLWAWCLERPISETTPVLWFGGNRWFSPPKESLDVREQLCLAGSWDPRPSGEAGS